MGVVLGYISALFYSFKYRAPKVMKNYSCTPIFRHPLSLIPFNTNTKNKIKIFYLGDLLLIFKILSFSLSPALKKRLIINICNIIATL